MQLRASATLSAILLTLTILPAHAKDAWTCSYVDARSGPRSSQFEVQKNSLLETRAGRGSAAPTVFTYGISENNAFFLVATHSGFSLNEAAGNSPESTVIIIDKDKGGMWSFSLSSTFRTDPPPIGKCVKR
jgi:hypothetical protein